MAHTHDEGFHEIQLNGKQLVFLFMAATVVSVVIFLCGVLVGRGVRLERGTLTDVAPLTSVVETTPPQSTTAPAPTPAGSDPTVATPPPAVDELSYFNRLDKGKPPVEQLKPASEKAAPAVEKAARPAASKAPPEDATAPEPSGQGFAVQIAALNVRSEAEAIAKRLATKGYAAYVLSPANGTPAVYRVRIGKFPTRREAETVASRLQKEEQFKPWVTR